jgi:hypothetical protein
VTSAKDSNEKGLTLMEVTVVTVLATVVMLGLTGFYLSSQFTWMDGSAKAMAQREGTFLLDTIRDSTHTAFWYDADPTAHQLSLYKIGESNAFYVFRWDPSSPDSALLAGPPGSESRILQSKVRRFDIGFVDSSIVELSALEVVSATGQPFTFRTRFALLNRIGKAPS